MLKPVVLFCLLLVQGFSVKAQENLYQYLKLGAYSVGFMDTVLFDSTYTYQAYAYNGKKPHFIQVWHPLTEQPKQENALTVNQFYTTSTNSSLSSVQQQLNKHYQEAVIRDGIEENLVTGEANQFGAYSHTDVLGLVGELATKSSFCQLKKPSQFPVIVYHHGAQSNSFENFAMAEYFASRGFIFVSANFHLPYENTLFGLKPFSKLIKNEDEQSLKTVLEFAQSLSNSSAIFFVGHSWGAQMGFRTLDGDSSIKGFVSLETTIEYKTDHEKIKEMWPEVYQKVVTDSVHYPFPMLLCAATGQEKPFEFFKQLNAQHLCFAPTKEEFEHNAYTSTFYLRYFINNNIPQPDKAILKDRLHYYVKHLELIHQFFDGILQNRNELPLVKYIE